MSFNFKVSAEELKGLPAYPPNVYDVMFTGFKPAKAKDGNSLNLNPQVKIMGGEYDGKPVFTSLNDSIASFIQDFVHSFGVPMEDPFGPNPSLPGSFDGDENDPKTWKYTGPLLGKTAKWELGIKSYLGVDKTEVRRFICSVPDCALTYPLVRHSTDMARK